MQAESLRAARDIVADEPMLLGAAVSDSLSEAARRSRQSGDVPTAEACEFRLSILRRFRELGLHEGYLELAIGALVNAKTPEEHRKAIRESPELAEESTLSFISRRIADSVNDASAKGMYELAEMLIKAREITGPEKETEPVDTTEAVNAFVHHFVNEPDPVAQRRLLEERPALLQLPLTMIVASMFEPFIALARTRLDFVTLRQLLLRQALFFRCQKVGCAQAFQELERGATWSELTKT
jgi:hypothetical protein